MKCVFILLLSLFPLILQSQTVLTYRYDSSGNRIKREIVMESRSIEDGRQNLEQEFVERLSEKDIKIYPNPTQGLLKIEIRGKGNDDTCRLTLHNSSSVQIYETLVEGASTEIDIRNNPNGIYLLSIELNGESSVWKIIKR